MTRFFGQLQFSVQEGRNIHHSYAAFRRRKTHASCARKAVCGADVVKCGGADPCGGKADVYLTVELRKGNRRYKVARSPTLNNTDSPKWNYEFSCFVDLTDEADPAFATEEPSAPSVQFSLMDDDGGASLDELLGCASLPLASVCRGRSNRERVEMTVVHPLARGDHKSEGKLVCTFHWFSFHCNLRDPYKLYGSYFPRVPGNEVRLYHDAHCHPEDFADLPFGQKSRLKLKSFHAENCWEDIEASLTTAKHVILVAGWSVHTALKLRRSYKPKTFTVKATATAFSPTPSTTPSPSPPSVDDGDGMELEGSRETLGELLRRKAEEGLMVVVMVWDDVTSFQAGTEGMRAGLMGTYDEKTRQFFANTKVRCVVAPRIAGDDTNVMYGGLMSALKGTSFTHHQKIVLCDQENYLLQENDLLSPTSASTSTPNSASTAADSGARSRGSRGRGREGSEGKAKRILCAYVGGLDLTNGRYDTSRHPLFDTLNTAHRDDFYNGCNLEAGATNAFREPWHDVHLCVLGPGAWDVLNTYCERLHKQAPVVYLETLNAIKDMKLAKAIRDETQVVRMPGTLTKESPHISEDPNLDPDCDPSSWTTQTLRSLDTESAVFSCAKYCARYLNYPPGPAGGSTVASGGTSACKMKDASLQAAYLQMIDRAKSFIYIENQYFLGSAQFWLQHSDVVATNLVPYAIVRRVCRAIFESTDFCAYILTPLYPEGVPSSGTVQEILQWQFQTMRFMYEAIRTALLKAKSDRRATDYLQFFFPGQREPHAKPSIPARTTPALLDALEKKRHPIYVHSKFACFDDTYLICGSANINDRSMAGSRDTEIAMGVYQPAFVPGFHDVASSPEIELPEGHVSRFRLQLWQEQFGKIYPDFYKPASVDCARLIHRLANENWRAFSSDEMQPMPHGYACIYPTLTSFENGRLKPDSSCVIPGTSSPVHGVRSAIFPGPLTT